MREHALQRFLLTLSITDLTPEAVPDWYSLVMNWVDLGSTFGHPRAVSVAQLAESNHRLMRLIGKTEQLTPPASDAASPKTPTLVPPLR
jgi:hypothetical protein